MPVLYNPNGYLSSAQSAEGTGRYVMDARHCKNFGYLFYQAAGHSAIFSLQASHDQTAWLTIATYTATATQTGTAQIAGFYPYIRSTVTECYSAAGGTGTLDVFYAPGI